MTKTETLAQIADGLLTEYGRELKRVTARGKLFREEYPRIFRRVVGRYFKRNRSPMRGLGYRGTGGLLKIWNLTSSTP